MRRVFSENKRRISKLGKKAGHLGGSKRGADFWGQAGDARRRGIVLARFSSSSPEFFVERGGRGRTGILAAEQVIFQCKKLMSVPRPRLFPGAPDVSTGT